MCVTPSECVLHLRMIVSTTFFLNTFSVQESISSNRKSSFRSLKVSWREFGLSKRMKPLPWMAITTRGKEFGKDMKRWFVGTTCWFFWFFSNSVIDDDMVCFGHLMWLSSCNILECELDDFCTCCTGCILNPNATQLYRTVSDTGHIWSLRSQAMETMSRNLGGDEAVRSLFDEMSVFDEPVRLSLSTLSMFKPCMLMPAWLAGES